ncbi:NADH pyrophosphatase [Orbilia blumenaviensis]|uniref:NAD(+) diphosphatase n=1 Tax=Orbilia blumenaviensis TaxID=1796055 RepID=A0AAV9V1E7_9PEZI
MAEEGFLTRKFGEGVENYYAGSPLNRLAFLRTNHTYLSTALQHPSTRFILLNNLDPLASTPSTLAFLSYSDISDLIANPYATSEQQLLQTFTSTVDHPVLIFLGIDESAAPEHSIPTPDNKYTGQAYFSLDVTPYPSKSYASTATSLLLTIKSSYPTHEFKTARKDLNLGNEHAAIYASARSLTNWNVTAPYCAGCGQKTMSVNAGAKRACPALDGGVETRKCGSREGVHNINFPRTDPSVIMAVISSDGTKILLGRQKRWPKYWHSTLAGFLEPGESIEEAVRREVWEESGVTVGRVIIHSSQPWPFPASLMIGAIGEAIPGKEDIYLGNDPELEGARWFGFEEVKEALAVTTGGLYDPLPEGYKEGMLRLPPKTAIANQLIRAVVLGEVHLAKI